MQDIAHSGARDLAALSSRWRGAGAEILRHRGLDQGFERLSIEHLSLPDVDGATRVSLETGVEEPLRVLQRGTPGEGQLDDLLVGLSRADDPSVGPNGHAHWVAGLDPFALLHDLRVRLVDHAADLRQGLGAPTTERLDPRVDETRGVLPGPALRLRSCLDPRPCLWRGLGFGRRLAWLACARRPPGLRLRLPWHARGSLLDPPPQAPANLPRGCAGGADRSLPCLEISCDPSGFLAAGVIRRHVFRAALGGAHPAPGAREDHAERGCYRLLTVWERKALGRIGARCSVTRPSPTDDSTIALPPPRRTGSAAASTPPSSRNSIAVAAPISAVELKRWPGWTSAASHAVRKAGSARTVIVFRWEARGAAIASGGVLPKSRRVLGGFGRGGG